MSLASGALSEKKMEISKEGDVDFARTTVNWGPCYHGGCVPDARVNDFVFCLRFLRVNHIVVS